MSLAVLASYALCGLQAGSVQVEVHVGPGLPAFSLTGLPGARVRESRERVRSALLSSGYEFPHGRITVNLAPADLPKDSGHFDLPIAIGILLASGQLADAHGRPPGIAGYVLAGELSLTGAVIATEAALVMALAAAGEVKKPRLIMASTSAQLAAQIAGLEVYQANSLVEVVEHLKGNSRLNPADPAAPQEANLATELCMSDVRGQTVARAALEIAASGGHGLLFCGPPGVGKSMLAQRLPGLLPGLSQRQAIEVAAIHGLVYGPQALAYQAPFRAPHHSATRAAVIGGGAHIRPGEISLAHHGVLFLDELPEFAQKTLEALREPLETGHINIARASGVYRFPARFQLVAAMNPCPCGWYGHQKFPDKCRCPLERVYKYQSRVSGPLQERIHLHVNLSAERSWLQLATGESSAVIRKRVARARQQQLKRQGCLNSQLPAGALQSQLVLCSQGATLVARAVDKWAWSTRTVHGVLRVARTIADQYGIEKVLPEHVAQAIAYRPMG